MLHREYCVQNPKPPEDIISRSRDKLQELLNTGVIESQVFDELSFREAWARLSDPNCKAECISFVLGQGIPTTSWLVIRRGTGDVICTISISDRTAASAIGLQAFITIVKHKLEKANIKERPNEAQIQACFLRAISGWKVIQVPIHVQSQVMEENPKPISLATSKKRREVSLLIRDSKAFTLYTEKSVILLAEKYAGALAAELGIEIKFDSQSIEEQWRELATSQLLLGIGLPKSVLLAFGPFPEMPVRSNDEKPSSPSERVAPSSDKATNQSSSDPKSAVISKQTGKLSINATEGGMIARVTGFNRMIYEIEPDNLNEAWLDQHCTQLGLTKEATAPHKAAILEALSLRKDLNGMIIATGKAGEPGSEPYLHPTYRFAKENFIKAHEGEFIDVRSLQSSEVVLAGDLVAEILCRNEPKMGTDVFGKPVDPPEPEGIKVTTGEGIIAKKGWKFYAADSGSPSIKGLSITLQKMYIHKGDVTLKTGNVNFDGPVEIRGNVDQGASVIARGPITILGNVEGGTVKSETSIFVQGGVITTEKGKLHSLSDISASYVENSKIICGGTLKVNKVLLNSTVFARVGVEVNPGGGGVAAGGRIVTNGRLHTADLGFKNGANTLVDAGSDWQREYSIQIQTGRKEKIQAASDRDRANLRELTGRKAVQLGKKHVERKEELLKKLVRYRAILEKIDKRIAQLISKIEVNPLAEVLVMNLLQTSVRIKVGGKSVPITCEYKEVAITPKIRKDGYIISFEDYKIMKEDQANAKVLSLQK